MNQQEKEELLTALLNIMPNAEVRHYHQLLQAAEHNPQGLHTREIINLTREGVIKIKQ
jgi:hypothetical protein